jgi:16S rRNA (cytosine967-C5)-methyltransferase
MNTKSANDTHKKQKKHRMDPPGVAARRFAADTIRRALRERRTLDDAMAMARPALAMEAGDIALARAIATVTFRRMGTLRKVLETRMKDGGSPDVGLLHEILLTGAAQILFMDVADHAAVDVAVNLAKSDRLAMHYAALVNALLRRVASEKAQILAQDPPEDGDVPAWLQARWAQFYGAAQAAAIGRSLLTPPHVDITVFGDAPAFAAEVGGTLLPTGSVRLPRDVRVDSLPGYAEGRFQVQDAASSLPARLIGARPGLRVLDLCAAPGGKTAQLAKAGASVVAVERSRDRAERLKENMARLDLAVEVVIADAGTYQAEPFDAVLLDAPCSATGTARRHPEIVWTKTLEDILKLAAQQDRLLAHAATLVKPGGILVYSTCSLEKEEGEARISAFLGTNNGYLLDPVDDAMLGIEPGSGADEGWTREGVMRSLPSTLATLGGVDGFFAVRLRRSV